MARLSKQSAKSRQNRVLRYVASTNSDKTAGDFGVSTKQLNAFLRAKPETVAKHPERFNKILSQDANAVARENQVKQVQKLSGKRLSAAYPKRTESERIQRSIRLSNATRTRYKTVENGKTVYKPIKETRTITSREQIINNMAGMNRKSIIDGYSSGIYTKDEARQLMRKLYRNSGLSAGMADNYLNENT